MFAEWIICDNHIALNYDGMLLHPNAEEVYRTIGKTEDSFVSDIPCKNLEEAFPNMHFSRVGSPIKCCLESENNDIFMWLYTERRGKKISIDIIEGEIIDQCVTGDEWFFISGGAAELSELFKHAGILKAGRLTCSQYVEIIKSKDILENGTLLNNVKTSLLNKPVDSEGELPKKLNAELYPYQKTGFFWMRYMLQENNGCILGDEMGLGKTLQVITLMLDFKQTRKTPMLVVAPVSLLQNWKRECEKFAPDLNSCVHHGGQRTGRYIELKQYDVVIISYSIAVNDSSLLSMIDWKLVVLDEAQNIKNPGSDRTKFVKKIPRQCSIAVTGTPFENHLIDIWSLADFVMPGLFGSQTEYKNYISDNIDGADKVEPMLSPIMIRRMVNDVAGDLPKKVVIPQPLVMSDEESLKYEDFREEALGESKSKGLNLASLQKLRMFCTHPILCGYNSGDPYNISVKYQRFCEIVDEICSLNEKAILFTSYQKMFDLLGMDIPQRFGIPVWKINGSTPVDQRQNIVDIFNKFKDSALLVLNPRAAGTGLNITSANHVIHYNLEWNPALEDQASARAYRRGQKKTVFVYRLYYENTVEQIVNDRIERKREMASAAVVGTDGTTENREDIIAALNISPIRG